MQSGPSCCFDELQQELFKRCSCYCQILPWSCPRTPTLVAHARGAHKTLPDLGPGIRIATLRQVDAASCQTSMMHVLPLPLATSGSSVQGGACDASQLASFVRLGGRLSLPLNPESTSSVLIQQHVHTAQNAVSGPTLGLKLFKALTYSAYGATSCRVVCIR